MNPAPEVTRAKGVKMQREWMENIYGEVVEIIEQEDGTAIGILEGEAVRTFKSFEQAQELLYKAGWRY